MELILEVWQNFHGSVSVKYNITYKRSEASDYIEPVNLGENCPSRTNLKNFSN